MLCPEGAILLVDDDEIIREVCSSMLRRFGFHVILAADGEEAVRICRERGEGLLCVILDLSMPCMDGISVLREIRSMCLDIKVILASGYGRLDVAGNLDELKVNGFMQKPYSMKDLLDELTKVLPKALLRNSPFFMPTSKHPAYSAERPMLSLS